MNKEDQEILTAAKLAIRHQTSIDTLPKTTTPKEIENSPIYTTDYGVQARSSSKNIDAHSFADSDAAPTFRKAPGPGLYISFDGPDGAGKTTLLKAIKKRLEKKFISHLMVREPGLSSELGTDLRRMILEKPVRPEVVDLLFATDRLHGLQTVVLPALKAGAVVISDRSFLSTLVYQGMTVGRLDKVLNLYDRFQDFFIPDVSVVCNLSEKEAHRRLSERAGVIPMDHFEAEDVATRLYRHRCFESSHTWSGLNIYHLDMSGTTDDIMIRLDHFFEKYGI